MWQFAKSAQYVDLRGAMTQRDLCEKLKGQQLALRFPNILV